MKRALLKLRMDQLSFDGGYEFRLTVRRRHLFNDGIKGIVRFCDPSKHLRVVFVGEAGIDEGGPKREFFQLFMLELSNNGALLAGLPGSHVLMHDALALQQGVFRGIGKVIALSLLNGGPGPQFFAPSIAKYILGMAVTKDDLRLEDVADSAIAGLIKKVSLCTFTQCSMTFE